jgi:hypothetical protein
MKYCAILNIDFNSPKGVKTMKQRLLLTVIVLLMVIGGSSIAMAQDGGMIEYGQVIVAEMTEKLYEFEYTFEGQAFDTVIILMYPVDILSDMDDPVLLLLDSAGTTIADSREGINVGKARLFIQLPNTGTYTIIATREDGADGDSVGEFTLEVLQPEIFTIGDSFTDTITNDDHDHYYVIFSKADFALELSTSGNLPPEMSVNVIDEEDASLDEIATLYGEKITYGTLGIFDSNEFYIVTIGKARFSFVFGNASMDYTVVVQ